MNLTGTPNTDTNNLVYAGGVNAQGQGQGSIIPQTESTGYQKPGNLTDNQLHSIANQQIGRDMTPYELSQYRGASIQTLANLGDTYKKLNTTSSISDYLKSIGQDSSMANITKLAAQYGISSPGTAAGNTALLKAMQSGAPPQPTVGGSIVPATPQTNAVDTTGTVTPSDNTTPSGVQIDPSTGQPIPGSIATAAQTSQPDILSQTVDTNPDVQTAKQAATDATNAYKQAQSQVMSIDAQINNLRTTMYSALQDKENQAAASGGVVDRAQIASEVAFENQGIQNQINDLMTQRSTYATAQSQAQQDMNTAIKAYTDAQSNFYKAQTLAQSQQKINNQASQFAQKLPQSAKYLKFTDPDSGQTYYIDPATGQTVDAATATASGTSPSTTPTADVSGTTASSVNNTSGIKSADGTFQQFATSSAGFAATVALVTSYQNGTGPQGINANSTLNDFVNMWITGNTQGTGISKGYTAKDVASSLGVTPDTKIGTLDPTTLASVISRFETGYNSATDTFSSAAPSASAWSTNDASLPPTGSAGNEEAYWTDPSTGEKVDTGRTINNVFQDAVTLAMDKSATPQKFLGGLSGNSGQGKALKNALSNKSSALIAASGVLQPVLQQEFAANTKAITTQIGYLNSTQRALAGAEQAGQLTQQLFSKLNINPLSSTYANATLNDLTKLFGNSADIRAYQSAMTEVGNEYAQVFARGGQRSVQGTQTAQEVINGDVKLADIQKTLDTLQSIGGTVISTSIDQVRSIAGGGGTDSVADVLNYVYGGNTPAPGGGGGTPSSTFTPRGSTDANTFVANTFSTLYPGQTEQTLQAQYGSQLPKGSQLVFRNSDGAVMAADPSKDDMSQYTPI